MYLHTYIMCVCCFLRTSSQSEYLKDENPCGW
nr:MAG TPA_asm: hypothetical protein [Caudoviricetes sp.]